MTEFETNMKLLSNKYTGFSKAVKINKVTLVQDDSGKINKNTLVQKHSEGATFQASKPQHEIQIKGGRQNNVHPVLHNNSIRLRGNHRFPEK